MRRRGLGAVSVAFPDAERVAEIKASKVQRATAEQVNRAACQIVRAGDGFGRKAFLSDAAAAAGTSMSPTFARLLAVWHRLGWVSLARADLTSAMDPEKVNASEMEIGGSARYHFISPKGCK